MSRHFFAVACVLLLAFTEAGAVNRCKMPDGRTVYQDAPCPAATASTQSVQLTPNTVAGIDPAVAYRRARAVKGSTPDETIQLKCQQDWPDDGRMRGVCINAQGQALRQLDAPILGLPGEVGATIRVRCEYAWPDDYRMRVVCERENIRAWNHLQTPLAVRADVAQRVRDECQKLHRADFRMRVVCEEKQLEAIR